MRARDDLLFVDGFCAGLDGLLDRQRRLQIGVNLLDKGFGSGVGVVLLVVEARVDRLGCWRNLMNQDSLEINPVLNISKSSKVILKLPHSVARLH